MVIVRRLEAPKWRDRFVGEFGVLAGSADGDRVQCHVCGEWFVSVGSHANAAHGIGGNEYRQLFGLAQSTRLVAPALSAHLRKVQSRRLDVARELSAAERRQRTAEELHDRHVVPVQRWRRQHVVEGAYQGWYQLWLERWEAAYERLETYVAEHGEALVPVRYRCRDGFHLGAWVVEQRERYRIGGLSADHLAALERLPGWAWDGLQARSNRKWSVGYRILMVFAEREGHACPHRSHVEGSYPLGAWVGTQRTLYGRVQLAADRVLALEALPGWVWDANDAAWERGFRYLEDHVAYACDSRVHGDYCTEDGYRLGQWVTLQRYTYRRGQLSAARATRLGALPRWQWKLR